MTLGWWAHGTVRLLLAVAMTYYGVAKLVWFEMHDTMNTAIMREKRIKKWNRDWKLNLIECANPGWDDLAIGFGFEPIATAKIMGSRLCGNERQPIEPIKQDKLTWLPKSSSPTSSRPATLST